MDHNDYTAAIDIGTTKVCVFLATRRADRRFEVAGIGSAPCDGLRKGAVTDAAAITLAVRRAASAASAKTGLVITKGYIGLAGTHIASESRWSHVPRKPGVSAVTDADLASALVSAAQLDPAPGRRVLHVLPRTYTLDGVQGIRNPAGMHASELHIQSQVISGSSDHIRALEDAVRAAGIAPAGIVVEPMASADAVLSPEEREGVTVLIDMGGGKTDIAVFEDGVMVYSTLLPVGGYQFTNDVSIAFSLPYEEAEQLKVERGTALPEQLGHAQEIQIRPAGMAGPLVITQRDLGNVLRERAEEVLEMLRIKLEAPEIADIALDRFVMTGGGAKLDGFTTMAKNKFQKKVRLGLPRTMEGLPDANRDPGQSAAMGIAIWAMRNLPTENHVTRSKQAAGAGGGFMSLLREVIPLWALKPQAGKPATKVS